jgi:glycosyltransferase involved in cell wall biosynthesis
MLQKIIVFFRVTWRHKQIRSLTISVVDTYLYTLARLLALHSPRHVHVVHGSGYPAHSYMSKKYLRWMPVSIYAVSEYSRNRLCHFSGLNQSRVDIIENFFLDESAAHREIRAPYRAGQPIRRVIIISRLEQPKRVDLLLEALERTPALADAFVFEVYGSGPEEEQLRARARSSGLLDQAVFFRGFHPDVSQRIADFDLFLHFCPVETFGLVYLEAMAAGVVSVGPDLGSQIIVDGETGFLFKADNVESLTAALFQVRRASAETLNAVADQAHEALATRYSKSRALSEYRAAIEGT